jgi:hypothetical protein
VTTNCNCGVALEQLRRAGLLSGFQTYCTAFCNLQIQISDWSFVETLTYSRISLNARLFCDVGASKHLLTPYSMHLCVTKISMITACFCLYQARIAFQTYSLHLVFLNFTATVQLSTEIASELQSSTLLKD